MMLKPTLFVGLLALFSASPHNPTARLEFGALHALTTPAAPGSAEPNLSLGPGGLVYLSWIELGPDSAHHLKFATLQGQRFGAARRIAAGAQGEWFVNWADFPSVIVRSGTHLVAHWLQRNGKSRYAYGVRVAQSADGGATWSAPLTPHRDDSETEHGFVSLFQAGNEIGITWLDGRTPGSMSVRFTTLAANSRLGADQQIDARACDCCQTSAAVTARGPVLVYRDRSSNEVRDIAIVRYHKGAWTQPRVVHPDNWVIAACPVNGPAVAARGERVAVAWFTAARDEARVNVAFSRNAGDSFRAPVRVDDGAPAGRVDVQMLPDHSALVSWLERVGDRSEVRVRRVFADGRRSPARTVAVSSAERASGFPHMIARRDDVIFAWTEPGRRAQVKAALLELK